jgi:hypothetical protein
MKEIMNPKNKNLTAIAVQALPVIALVAVLVGLHVLLSNVGELWYGTNVKDMWALATPFFIRVFWPLVGIIAIIGAGIGLLASYKSTRAKNIAGTSAIIIGVVALIGSLIPGSPLVSAANRSGFEAKKTYLARLTETKESHPEYLERANYVQAAKILTETVNDSSVGGFSQAQYTVANGEPAWCAGVLSNKDGRGRQYVTGVRCLTAANKVVKAKFNGRVPSIDGAFSTNLAKQIAESKPGMSIDKMDVRYAIIDSKAISVASVTRIEHDAYTPHRVPGGVFVFDDTGKMTYRASVKAGEFGFAVLPYGIAEQVRGALNTKAGFWCASHLTKAKCVALNQPLEDTQHVSGELQTGDINAANYSEFVLHRANGGIAMVTPLTMYGKGRNVVAYLDVDADSVTNGVMPKATLFKGVMEVSNRMLAQTISPAYTADITWITEINGESETATGSRIYEVTPTKAGEVVATIGTATNPQYKVKVAATVKDDSLDFSWCISDLNSGKNIECRTRANGEAPIGTLRGLATGNQNSNTDNTPNKVEVGTSFDVAKLTVAELQKLINDAAAELAKR